MSESRDTAIKLFGKTIPLPPATAEAAVKRKDLHIKEITPESTNKDHESPETEKKDEPLTPSRAHERLKPCSADHKDTAAEKYSTDEETQHEAENSQERLLKKPDKILPCPRCNSMDTKFCYYNNYNVNQPRHFCKNCQRYWTAGGAMRNVPVGAGRRKNKSCLSHYRHLTMSEAYLQAAGSNIPQTIQHSPTKQNETVLSFSTDIPLCESVTSAVNHGEKTMKNCQRNGSHLMNEKVIPFASLVESDEHSTVSSVTPPSSAEEGNRANSHRIPAPIPCFNGYPWPYPWTTAPTYCTSGFSIPVYPPTTYWRYAVPNNWSIPFVSPDLSTSPESTSVKSTPSSPSLGKHSRQGDVFRHNSSEKRNDEMQNKQERCLWVPKTLRIDNPDEAAKSSTWAMTGIQNDKTNELGGRRMFRAFQPKADMKGIRTEASQAQHTNPAALSRSVSFQERS